jgi:hypothetical protein
MMRKKSPPFFYLFLKIHSEQECLKGEYKYSGEAPVYRHVMVACLFTHELLHEAVSSSSII